jgi:hypothetical protein
VSGRAETLQRIDDALVQVGAIEAVVRAARLGHAPGIDRDELSRRFRAIADAGTGHHVFTPVQELAALAERVTDGTDRSVLHSEQEIEVVQHAADVLSLLLRDIGLQLLGRRGGDVAPVVGALRERLEHVLLAARR